MDSLVTRSMRVGTPILLVLAVLVFNPFHCKSEGMQRLSFGSFLLRFLSRGLRGSPVWSSLKVCPSTGR